MIHEKVETTKISWCLFVSLETDNENWTLRMTEYILKELVS